MMNESYDYVPIIHLWMYYVCTYLLAQININSITISKLVSKRLQGVWSKNFNIFYGDLSSIVHLQN